MEHLKALIRDIPDFPEKGVIFRDITPLLADAKAFHETIETMAQPLEEHDFDLVVGIESRGFFFSSALATRLGKGQVPVRKPGKLPSETIQVTYRLEYGADSLEMHADAIQPGQRVVIVDDVLATGGTARGVADLVEKLGAKVVRLSFLIELDFLKGREKLNGYDVHALLNY